MGFLFLSRSIEQDKLISYLRLDGGINEQYSTARAMNWEKGYQNFWSYGLFGKGLLSKFGNNDYTFRVMGIEFPTYDWTTDADPLNSFFSMSQQIGIPGGIIFMIFLAVIFFKSFGLPSPAKYAVFSLLIPGLVFGLIDGNWLTSFGDPVDRFCMMAIALAFAVPYNYDQRGSNPGFGPG